MRTDAAHDIKRPEMLGLDLNTIRHAWLSPEGEFHVVGQWCHDVYAEDVLVTPPGILEALGWVKLTGAFWRAHRVTQAQCDAIWDWCQYWGTPMPTLEVI